MRIERIEKQPEVKELITEQKIDLKLLDPLIKRLSHKKGNLIPLLQGTQDIFGYIPPDALKYISDELGLKMTDMYGVVTFYAQFKLKPVGKYIIRVCHGTACHVQNADKISDDLKTFLEVKDGDTTVDGIFTLESVACLGCCSLAPVMMIGDDTFGKLTGKKAVDVVKEIRRKENLSADENLTKNTLSTINLTKVLKAGKKAGN